MASKLMKMLGFNEGLPQVSRKYPESHTDISVCSTDKTTKKYRKSFLLHISAYNAMTVSSEEKMVEIETKITKMKYVIS